MSALGYKMEKNTIKYNLSFGTKCAIFSQKQDVVSGALKVNIFKQEKSAIN